MSDEMIGPLTAAEWCEFRLRAEGDFLMCCGITSDFRDEVFELLRMGGDDKHWRHGFRGAYWRLVDHGLPDGRAGELIARLVTYFLGDPPEPKQDIDDMTDEEIVAELKARTGAPKQVEAPRQDDPPPVDSSEVSDGPG